MNWKFLRHVPWIDTRARFVSTAPRNGLLLDLGASDGETLKHFSELRPDLNFAAADIAGKPERYPHGCDFQRCDLNRDKLQWADDSFDAVSCLHLVEHLDDLSNIFGEVERVLKPGGRAYFETPHPKTVILPSIPGSETGTFTMNFYDDPTHKMIVSAGALACGLRAAGLLVRASGTSRNLAFAASHLVYWMLPPSRQKFTARIHWIGWSAYVIVEKSAD